MPSHFKHRFSQTYNRILAKSFTNPLITLFKSQTQTILLVALFIMLTGNIAMFSRILNVYPLRLHNIAFLSSLFIFFSALTMLFLLSISHGRFTRWVLAFFLIGASFAAYYMDQFGVIIDGVMLDNIIQTQSKLSGSAGLSGVSFEFFSGSEI